MALNKKQEQIFQIIKNKPNITLKEIAKELGLKSISNIHAHIQNMIEKDFLKRNGRSLIINNPEETNIAYIPFYGNAQCGYNDILNESNVVDYIPMPARFLPAQISQLFLIKAQGDSMEPTISNGELLLFSKLNYGRPKENEIVLCFYGESLKVKRFNSFKDESGRLQHRLISDNKTKFEPLLINSNDDFSNKTQIIAKLTKIIKSV